MKDTIGEYRYTVCAQEYMHTYLYLCVCVDVYMYTYINQTTLCAHTNLHMCVYTLAYMHADFTCGCVDV